MEIKILSVIFNWNYFNISFFDINNPPPSIPPAAPTIVHVCGGVKQIYNFYFLVGVFPIGNVSDNAAAVAAVLLFLHPLLFVAQWCTWHAVK